MPLGLTACKNLKSRWSAPWPGSRQRLRRRRRASPAPSSTELKAINGASITTTQLVSRLYSLESVRNGMSMPIHKSTVDNERPPALIHRIESSLHPNLSHTKAVPRYSHVITTVKVSHQTIVRGRALKTDRRRSLRKTRFPAQSSGHDGSRPTCLLTSERLT